MALTPFQLVLGVHDCTPVPAAARAHGLMHRFALVQSTHAVGLTDLVVDPAPLLTLLGALDAQFDDAGTLYWDINRRRRAGRAEIAAHYDANVLEDYRIVSAGEWRRRGQIAVLLVVESWHVRRGPAPYDDSITYAFYSDGDLAGPLQDALADAGLAPTAVITAPEPLTPPHPATLLLPFHLVALTAALFTAAAGMVNDLLQLERWLGPASLWMITAAGLGVVWLAAWFIWRQHASDLR
jgi:hypothetical protein